LPVLVVTLLLGGGVGASPRMLMGPPRSPKEVVNCWRFQDRHHGHRQVRVDGCSRATRVARGYFGFGAYSWHQPFGLIFPSTVLQLLGGTKCRQLSHSCGPFGFS
jgi:hypothetical protein